MKHLSIIGLCLGLLLPTAAHAQVNARYVRVLNNETQELNLAELRVIHNGSNVALGKTVTASSIYLNYEIFRGANLVDGNIATFAHTDDAANQWLEVDLGAVYALSSVEIVNRQDACCTWRSNNLQLVLKDGFGKLHVFQSMENFQHLQMAWMTLKG